MDALINEPVFQFYRYKIENNIIDRKSLMYADGNIYDIFGATQYC